MEMHTPLPRMVLLRIVDQRTYTEIGLSKLGGIDSPFARSSADSGLRSWALQSDNLHHARLRTKADPYINFHSLVPPPTVVFSRVQVASAPDKIKKKKTNLQLHRQSSKLHAGRNENTFLQVTSRCDERVYVYPSPA